MRAAQCGMVCESRSLLPRRALHPRPLLSAELLDVIRVHPVARSAPTKAQKQANAALSPGDVRDEDDDWKTVSGVLMKHVLGERSATACQSEFNRLCAGGRNTAPAMNVTECKDLLVAADACGKDMFALRTAMNRLI